MNTYPSSTTSTSVDPSTVNEAGGVTLSSTPLENSMRNLVDDGFPAALATRTTADGHTTHAAVGDAADGELRIGSNTKMYVATIVMQLVDEGRVELDLPVETYLPGLVTGNGNGIDGTVITVRQLLQHTSGLPEYASEIAADAFAAQHLYVSPRDLLDVALATSAVFVAGERWEYSNTNYLVLGILIERLTKRPLYEQVHTRIAAPLGLEHTYMPRPGEQAIRGDHPLGYHLTRKGKLQEFTTMDPSFAWAAGSMVASASDLNRFMQALLAGELVSGEALEQMKATVPAGDQMWPGALYGLGLLGMPLSRGGMAWGHGGDIPGMQTRNAVGPGGTAVTIAVNALPWALVDMADINKVMAKYAVVVDALDAALCAP